MDDIDIDTFAFRVTKLIASAASPLPFVRGNIRDLPVGSRYQGATTMHRLSAGMNVSMALVLDRIACGDLETWCMEEDDADIDELLAEFEDSDSDDDDVLIDMAVRHFELADWTMRVALHDIFRPQLPSQLRRICVQTRRTVDDYSDSMCLQHFRFSKVELKELFANLRFPASFRSDSRRIFQAEESFLIMVRRLATSPRFIDMEAEFGYRSAALSESFNITLQWMDWQYGHLVDGTALPPPRWEFPTGLGRWSSELATWAQAVLLVVAIAIPVAIFGYVCCFIDGTFRPMSRPNSKAGIYDNIQKTFYTRYKKGHGLVYQLIMAPNGIFIDMLCVCVHLLLLVLTCARAHFPHNPPPPPLSLSLSLSIQRTHAQRSGSGAAQ